MAPARILHLSDLHMGKREEPELGPALASLVAELAPELVVASGDLTHRGRREQHESAHAFLAELGPPVLAIPGNHDIPYTFPARFTSPWAEFERLWETVEPVHSSPAFHVVGLNSVRPWRHQSGGLSAAALERATARLSEAPEGALRVAVLHHHLLGAPWRTRKRPVARRDEVLDALAAAGADLILGGHTHQAEVGERRDFAVTAAAGRALIAATAPGLGRPRPHRSGEARGLHVHETDGRTLTVHTYIWRDEAWLATAARSFPLG
jgi:3',5'-cyclic AMP phosphodiesterase CpdA